jgi:hypothetical protein
MGWGCKSLFRLGSGDLFAVRPGRIRCREVRVDLVAQGSIRGRTYSAVELKLELPPDGSKVVLLASLYGSVRLTREAVLAWF